MLRRVVAAVLCVVFLTGCGETSFLGRRYDNFTAYYNTFYNARKSFERGVKAIEQVDQPIDQDRFLAVYPIPTRAGNRQDFDDTVKKSADVIRDHPGSKWVDDAVLLIGKSYFYQQNYVSAAQKFREAIALESSVEDEARFWLGYALTANGSLLEARDELARSLDRDELEPSWEPALNLLLGDVLVKLKEWDDAVTILVEGADKVRDREAEARARFLIGQLEEMRGAFQRSHDAYAEVQRLQPNFELGVAARLSELRLAARIGEVEHALGELRRLERDDKFRDRRAQIAYVRGLMLQEAGDSRAARDEYTRLLYESDFDISSVRARVHYALATYYRDAAEDFVMAAAHFDTAATSLQAPQSPSATSTEAPLTSRAISDSRQQADVYNTYARVYEDVARMDSLLHLGRMPDDEFQDAVREMRIQLQQEMAARQRAAERQRGEAEFAGAFAEVDQNSGQQAEATVASSAGFLFHRDPVRVQEGRQSFVRRWGERPLVPGWRRREAVDAFVRERSEEVVAAESGAVQQFMTEEDADLPPIDLSDVPRTEEAQRQMMMRRAFARYELGNVLFISMNRPDSAAAVYQLVIDEDAELPVAGRAFYALAELERSRGRIGDANNLYRVVLERYPGSEFEDRVREQLGMEVGIRTDSLALARARFDELMRLWNDGDHQEALSGMIELSLDAPDEQTATASLMAAARIGVDWLRRDSLALTSPLAVSLSDSLLQRAGMLDPEPETITSPRFGDSLAVDSLTADSVGTDAIVIQPRLLEEHPVVHSQPTVRVEQILSRLSTSYPNSPLAAQARSMLSEIESRRVPPEDTLLADADGDLPPDDAESMREVEGALPDDVIDEAAEERPDERPAAPASPFNSPRARPDSTTAVVEVPEQDSTDTDKPGVDTPPADAYSLRGEGGIVDEAGGWTLDVGEVATRDLADSLAAELRAEGFRTDVREQSGDEPSFRIYVGQFQQRGLAEVALRTHRQLLPDEAKVAAVPSGTDSP